MSKKNSFGKLLAFTTTVAAIGGACYIFRDQIKESEIYKKSVDKLSALRNKMSDKYSNEDDDFFFDDEFEDTFEEDVFSDDAKQNREYTSITINAKEETFDNASDAAKEVAEDIANAVKSKTEDMKEIFADNSIPTISFGSNQDSEQKEDSSATEEVLGYENEGLSDVDEDPDALEEQDKLDF